VGDQIELGLLACASVWAPRLRPRSLGPSAGLHTRRVSSFVHCRCDYATLFALYDLVMHNPCYGRTRLANRAAYLRTNRGNVCCIFVRLRRAGYPTDNNGIGIFADESKTTAHWAFFALSINCLVIGK
jgi:hypothetical protein